MFNFSTVETMFTKKDLEARKKAHEAASKEMDAQRERLKKANWTWGNRNYPVDFDTEYCREQTRKPRY